MENCAKKVSLHSSLVFAIICEGSLCDHASIRHLWSIYVLRDTGGEKTWEFFDNMQENVTRGINNSKLVIPDPRDLLLWTSGQTFKTKTQVFVKNELRYDKENGFIVNTPPKKEILRNSKKEIQGCFVTPKDGEAVIMEFILSCAGWVDEDTPLTYNFRYQFISSTIIIQSGLSPNASTTLPLGDPKSGYRLTLEVEIRDALGDPTIHQMQATVRNESTPVFEVTVICGFKTFCTRPVSWRL